MFSIKKLFAPQAIKPSSPWAEDAALRFAALGREIISIGKMQGRDRSTASVSLNNKDVAYEHGTKEWIRVEDDAFYIRYYDTALKSCESLYVLRIDYDKEKFIFQRRHEFDNADEAIAVFVNLLEDYADAAFIGALKEHLVEKNILRYDVGDGGIDAQEDISEPAQAPKRQIVAPIK